MTEFANNGKSNYFSSYNFIEINDRDTEGAIQMDTQEKLAI